MSFLCKVLLYWTTKLYRSRGKGIVGVLACHSDPDATSVRRREVEADLMCHTATHRDEELRAAQATIMRSCDKVGLRTEVASGRGAAAWGAVLKIAL